MSMIIKKLELQGFKSFAERTKIVFHPGLTAIVGPNGTGKSNLVDAMLWVLGGLRVKSVRGDRTEDVIFNGNAKKPPLNMADVLLTLGSDEEEMVVSHRVFRTGEGEYRLNGKAVRLKDVQDELWKHAIGEKEYFVIEQGAIGNFVTSKPTEKRTFIEEAAGTAYYKDKKRQAQTKLENTGINLTRLEDIIAEVEKAKNSLQRQAQAANRYRRLRERIRELTSHHYRRKFAALERSQKEASSLYESSLAREQDVSARVRTAEKEAASRRHELWDLENSLKEAREKLYGLESHLTRLESEIERETKRVEFFDERRKRSEADGNELLEDVLHLTREIEETRQRLDAIAAEHESSRAEAARRQDILRAAREERDARQKEVEDRRAAYLGTLQGLTETRNQGARADKELELLARQEEKLTAQLAAQAGLLADAASRAEAAEREAAARTAAGNAAAARVEELKAAAAGVMASISAAQADLETAKTRRDEAAYQLQALKKIEEQQRGEARSDEIPGSLGLLADLLRTRPEDAPLFDVFWREEARSRVVPAEAVLEGIPEGLKGAYLLLPAAGRPGIPPDLLARPGVLGLLKSRLEADPRIKDRLAGLEDAVIVADIKEGVRLWLEHRELNYLTPAGDLLLSSGLLKLGEKAGGMIALASEIRSLEELGARLETEMAPLAARLEAAGREKAGIDEALEEATSSQLREERAARDAAKELHFIRTEGDKIRAAHDLLGRELEIMREEKDALVRSLKKTTEIVSGHEEEARALKAKTEAGERDLAESTARAAEAERGFLAVEAGLALLQEKTNGLRRQMETTASRKAALEAKISQIGEDTRRGEEEKARLRETIQGLRDSVGNLASERGRSEAALADSEARLQKIRTGLEESEAAVQEARREEESAKDERVRHEIRKAEVERDLVNLDEMCWQELKKTLAELKAEAQEIPSVQAAPAPAGDEDIEDSDEPGEEPAEAVEAGADEAAGPGPATEAARPRRTRKVRRPVAEMSDDDVEKELEETRESLNRFKAVNLMAEEEFLEQRKRYDFLVEQRRDLRESIASTEEAIRRIDEESKVQFLKALGEVNTNFQQIFAVLFKGGNAEVKLLEPDNPLESGVEIVAQPPGKRVQNLSLLSGGEKSLTSLSFLFALFRYRPSPFCFLDEVDAALDDVNLTRFLDLLNTIKHQTQFILITHNYKTMEVADYIYGTTMSEPNMTKLLSVKLEKKGGGEILNNIS